MRTTTIVQDIKQKLDTSKFDFSFAEHRADFDDLLRDEIAHRCGNDRKLLQHVADMCREWRRQLYRTHSREDLVADLRKIVVAVMAAKSCSDALGHGTTAAELTVLASRVKRLIDDNA